MQYIRPIVCFAYSNSNRICSSFLFNQIRSRNLKQSSKWRKCQTSIVMFSLSWFSMRKQSTEKSIEQDERMLLLSQADQLFKNNHHRELCTLLNQYKDGSDVEILWRLVRAQYNLAQEHKTSPEEKKTLIMDGYKTIERSLALDGDHFANHKWMSIMLDSRSCYFGIKARITQLENVKHHMVKAIELNPKDATTLYMLGVWCFEIANMPWYQRRIAAAIFASPPVSTFEEALDYFSRAEETEPRFCSMNLLMLGKTYLKLNKMDKARYYLDLASNYPAITDDDLTANKEASALLKSL